MWFGIELGLECMAMGYSEGLQGDCAVRANTMGYDDMVETGELRVVGKWLPLHRTRGDQALVYWYMGWIGYRLVYRVMDTKRDT